MTISTNRTHIIRNAPQLKKAVQYSSHLRGVWGLAEAYATGALRRGYASTNNRQ